MNNQKEKNMNNKHLGHEEENKDLCDTCYDRWENFNHKNEKKKEHEHDNAAGHKHHHGKETGNKNKVNKVK